MAKYLVFTDMHLHEFSEFSQPDAEYGNSRLRQQIEALREMLDVARREGRIVLFLGDLFHQRGTVKTTVFNWGFKTIANYPDVPIYLLEGNHDNINNSIRSASSLEPFASLPNVTLVETYQRLEIGEDAFTVLSYGEEFEELKNFMAEDDAPMFLGHLGVEGAIGAGKSKLDGHFTVGDFDKYELALLGHYHKRQELAHNVFYVGNPIGQNFADTDEHKGYMTFETKSGHYVERSLGFIPLDYPMFMTMDMNNLPNNAEALMESNFIRLRGEASEIKKVQSLSDDIANNIRMEATFSPAEDETRINISADAGAVGATQAWAHEFQPDNADLLVAQIKRALDN